MGPARRVTAACRATSGPPREQDADDEEERAQRPRQDVEVAVVEPERHEARRDEAGRDQQQHRRQVEVAEPRPVLEGPDRLEGDRPLAGTWRAISTIA